MEQGSFETYMVAPFNLQSFIVKEAAEIEMISACAVGSVNLSF